MCYIVIMQLTNRNPVLVLNRVELDKHHNLTDKELARTIGVDESTLWRLSTGKASPSGMFIARVKLAFPSVNLNKVFTAQEARKAA